MKIVVTYDCESERTRVIHVFLSEYIDWMQQSVFEGTVSEEEYESIHSWIRLFVEEGEIVKIYNLTEGETITIGNEQSTNDSIDATTLYGVGESSFYSHTDSINPLELYNNE